MRIGVNAHLLPCGETYRSAGVARYVFELVTRLPRLAPQHEFVFFTPPGMSGAGMVPSHLRTANPLARIVWESSIGPMAARHRHLDLVHGPVNVGMPFSGRPSVITLHDLAFIKYPELFSRLKAEYLKHATARSVRAARRVIAPSRSTRRDVIEYFGLREDLVKVVPLGVDERFKQIDIAPPVDGPIILYVGTIEPRKNLPMLLRSFAQLKKLGYPHRLALIGAKGWMYESVYQMISENGISGAVLTPGFVPDLLPWYNSAAMFVYPSLYEGFGLPPLEAMACGVPVITSSAGSLREVVDDAALVVGPNDEAGLVGAMREIIDNQQLARHLSECGIARAKVFSWDKTVNETIRIYEEAVRDMRD